MAAKPNVGRTFRRLPLTPWRYWLIRAAQVSQAPVNYFEATLAFGDLTLPEATANLTAFAETVMPAVRAAFAARAASSG